MERFYVNTKLKGAAGFALIKSFKEDCEKIGWMYLSDSTPFTIDMFNSYYPYLFFSGDFDDTKAPKMVLAVGSDLLAHFCLEEEYELALKQAKTVYEKITAAPKIQPKRGDYMFVKSSDNGREWIYIASGVQSYLTGRICSYSTSSSSIHFNDGIEIVTLSIGELRYATSEEKKILDEALWDQGHIFNRFTLSVETIPKPGELCILWSGDVTHAVIGQVTAAFTKGIFGRNGKTYTDWVPFKSIPQYLNLIRGKDCS